MKKLIIGLFFVVVGWGQNTGQNVINTHVINNRTVTGIDDQTLNCSTSSCPQGASAKTIQNIGQSSHELQLVITGASGTGNSINALIQGSLDNVKWFSIGQTAANINVVAGLFQQNILVQGFGSYPYLRTSIELASLNPGDTFTTNATYIGNSTPSAVKVDMFGSSARMLSNCAGAIGITGCKAFTNSVNTVDSGASAIGAVTQATVYGLNFNLPATATQLVLVCGSAINQNDGVFLALGNFPATVSNYTIPTGLRPIIQCPPGDSVFVLYRDSGAGVAYGTIYYRLE